MSRGFERLQWDLARMLVLAMLLSIAVSALAELDVQTTTVVVVRHAEKVDDSDDPPLSPAGEARAEALVEVLAHSPPDAIYASQYRRTQDTVAPAAARFGLELRIDPVERPIEDWARRFADQLIAAHPGGTVLIAGHSNTVPALVAKLCACEVAPLPDHVYDRVYILRSSPTGAMRLITARYGEASLQLPDP